ncbi:hypothetical protein K2Z83_17925 [Oscillochloris sp. ZM17-4]|uniref:FFLEELY motif protein n=1 Tax=Oscillochloris sp. ZM17-4 TaxID=2866714 RepID=UPI001C731F7D|nr:hypothetical protein [Oscillochloris sp. ZM17-4]MBX0329552.1 hypothetical protein [Oscillochloris sp. ZM17-4]
METFRKYRIALQVFQSNRLRRDYNDLASIPMYEPVGEFFFEELYGPRDFSERDDNARRLQHFLHIVPGVRLRDVEELLDLISITAHLDDGLTLKLIDAGAPITFDEPLYERLYREADNYDERMRQLELIRSCLLNVFQLSRSGLLGIGLERSGLIARLAGFEAGHTFLLAGYRALRNVNEIDHFATTIYNGVNVLGFRT